MQRSDVFSRLYKQMNETTVQLIKGCREGKRSAQLGLYKQFAQRLYIACLRIVGNSGEAEEAMQDSFLKIFTHIDQYKDGQCFEAWIHRIAVHTAIDCNCAAAKSVGMEVVGVYDPFYESRQEELRRICHKYIRSFEELL